MEVFLMMKLFVSGTEGRPIRNSRDVTFRKNLLV